MNVQPTDDPAAGEAAETLRRVADVRQGTRRLINAAWFPMLLWGSIVLVSAPITLAPDWAIGVYWLLAAPAGLLLTFRYFRRRALEHGLGTRNWRVYRGLGVAIAVACAALGAAGSEIVSAVGPMYAVALGVLGFAALSRVALYAWAALALIGAATLIVVADPADPILVAALAEGVLLLAAGLAALIGDRQGVGAGTSATSAQTG